MAETKNQTTVGGDELQWLLAGIRDERKRTEERLQYLVDREQKLTHQAMTGTPAKAAAAQPKPAAQQGKPKSRKRPVPEETRKKMRDAQKKRWADRKAAEAAQAAPPAPVVSMEETSVPPA